MQFRVKIFFSPPFFLLALLLVAYFPSIFNELCVDDIVIFSAAYPKRMSESYHLLFEPVAHGLIDHYRPIPFFSFVVDMACWGNRPHGYHLTNLVLAGLAMLAFYRMACILSCRRSAFWASVAFILFPGHSEAILSVYNRSQVFSTLFTFLSLTALLRILSRQKISRISCALSAIYTLLACLCKESGLVVPALSLLLVMHYRPPRFLFKHVFGGVILQVLAVLVYLTLRYEALGTIAMSGVDPFLRAPSPTSLYMNVSYFLTRYLVLVLYPVNLSCDYPLAPVSLHWSGALFLGIVLLSAVAFFSRGREARWAGLGMLWFLLSLLPVLHLVPMQIAMAERFLYPAYPGIALLWGKRLSILPKRYSLLAALFWGIMLAITFDRCFDWKNNDTVWTSALQRYPRSYRAKIYLGSKAARNGDMQKALEYYEDALRLDPNRDNRILIHQNQAIVWWKMKKEREALDAISRVLEIHPGHSPAWIFLGDVAAEQKRWQEAFDCYEKSRRARNRWDKEYSLILDKKGKCLMALGEWEKTWRAYRDAIYYDPENPDLYARSGSALMEVGKYEEAVDHLKKGLTLSPRSYVIHYLLSKGYKKLGQMERSRHHYQNASDFVPKGVALPNED